MSEREPENEHSLYAKMCDAAENLSVIVGLGEKLIFSAERQNIDRAAGGFREGQEHQPIDWRTKTVAAIAFCDTAQFTADTEPLSGGFRRIT